MTKSQEIKRFLEDFISLCDKLKDAEPNPEYYGLVKKSVKEFKAKWKGVWAGAFIALLISDALVDIEETKKERGPAACVWSTMEKVQKMVDSYHWEEDAQ